MIEWSVHEGKGLTIGRTAQDLVEIYITRHLLASHEEHQVEGSYKYFIFNTCTAPQLDCSSAKKRGKLGARQVRIREILLSLTVLCVTLIATFRLVVPQ